MKDRNTLEYNLNKVLKEIKHNRHLTEDIKSFLIKRDVMRGKTQRILNGNTPLEDIDKDLLCLLSLKLFDITGLNSISPYEYFSKEQIDKSSKKEFKIKSNEIDFPIIINNALKFNGEYIANVKGEFLLQMYNSNLLRHNYELNMDFNVKRNVSGNMIKSANVDQDLISNLKSKMINDKYLSETIKLNVLKRNGNELSYDDREKTITINKSDIFILNGFHDLNALLEATERDPSLKVSVQLNIKHSNHNEMRSITNKLKLKGGVR